MKHRVRWRIFIVTVFLLFLGLRAGRMYPVSAASEQGAVELTVGRAVYYGTYSTNYFNVEGKTAYCLEPLKDTPESGHYAVHPLDGGAVRKGIYYVYGGPGYALYQERFGRIGIGNGYSQDDEYCMSHCILSYLYSGNDSAFTGLDSSVIAVLKERVQNILSLPEPPEAFYAFLFNMDGSGQVMGGSGRDRSGEIEVGKRSDRPEWTADNPCYSLEGAVFGIYRPGEDTPAWTIKTDADGYGKLEDVPIGTYEIAEIESPRGFALNAQRQQIRVEEGEVFRYECVNKAQYYPAQILLNKVDAETGEQRPQGTASLEDAEFEVKYYAGYYDSDPGAGDILPERTWILRTNAAGELELSDACKVSGDEFYKNDAGEYVLPLGTVTFREVKAPAGYLLNETVVAEKISAEGTEETDVVYHVPEFPEQVVRGGLQIVKFREDEDENEDQKTSLEGIIFTVTSKTTEEQTEIVTDKNGYAVIQQTEDGRGGLVYDTYVVSERNAPAGLLPVEDFEVTVSEEGQTLYYILEDKRVFSPVRLVKKDAETGEVIPIAGAEFQLLDQDKNPVTMTVHYPQETVYSAFKTDESGSFVLPDRLPAGIYYFQEKRAPEGYILSKEPVRFEITEDHEWGDPFVAEIADKPAKGRFCIRKTDEETGDAVPGAKFEIRAKEDIRTPAGTLLMAEGSLAGVLATGADGTAESDSLPLGRYEIQEIEQAPGYVLSEEVYEAELKYEDQETEIATVNIEFTNKPTTVILWKTEEGTGGTDSAGGAAGAEGADDVQGTAKGLEGVKFTVWKKEEATQNADGAGEPDHTDPEQEASGWDVPEENIHVTDENGRIILRYLTPGTYCVWETESIPGYLRDDAVWEFTVDQTGKVEGKACVEYRIENKKTQIADTLAFWQESGNKEIYAGEDNVIIDMVSLQNLEAGQVYTLRGMLADSDTGEILDADGSPAAGEREALGEKTFTAENSSQKIQMEFSLDSTQLEEKRIVVFESLYIGDILISTHENPEDGRQTVSVLKKPEEAAATGDQSDWGRGAFAAFAAALISAGYLAVRFRKIRNHKVLYF